MITQEYDLNLVPNTVDVVVPVSQFDYEGRTIKFNVYNGSTKFNIPSGSSVVVTGRKPDAKIFDYACTYSGSVVNFNVKQQMTAVSGDVICEIRIRSGNQNIGSLNFILRVENTPYFDSVVISETDLDVINGAEDAAMRAEQAAASMLNIETGQAVIYESGGSIAIWATEVFQKTLVKKAGIAELHLNMNLIGTATSLSQLGYLPDSKWYPKEEINLTFTPNRGVGSPYVRIQTDGGIYIGGWKSPSYSEEDYEGLRVVITYITR